MAIRKLVLKASEEHRGQRLDQVLGQWLPQVLQREVSKAKARKLIVAGAVYLNGKRVRIASKELLPGARIEAFIDEAKLFEQDGKAQDRPFEMSPSRILYEDEFLIAVDKPPGLPTQPTLDEARTNLYASLKKFLAQRDSRPEAYVGLHHRLDRDTSGVILFTKKTEANSGVADLFSKHLAQKSYWALTVPVHTAPPKEWSVRNFLGRAPGGGKRAKYAAVRSGGDPAHTDFRLLEKHRSGLWVEALPRTGRTHQIRVHLSEQGLPIQGDSTYGPRGTSEAAPRLMLHAHRLEFPHPITQQPLVIESPMPVDFKQQLEKIRNS